MIIISFRVIFQQQQQCHQLLDQKSAFIPFVRWILWLLLSACTNLTVPFNVMAIMSLANEPLFCRLTFLCRIWAFTMPFTMNKVLILCCIRRFCHLILLHFSGSHSILPGQISTVPDAQEWNFIILCVCIKINKFRFQHKKQEMMLICRWATDYRWKKKSARFQNSHS